jgi:hypothetical protein
MVCHKLPTVGTCTAVMAGSIVALPYARLAYHLFVAQPPLVRVMWSAQVNCDSSGFMCQYQWAKHVAWAKHVN